MKVYSGSITTKESKVPIWPLGDIHYGHEFCDIATLKKYIKWAVDAGAYVFLMGDLIEAALPIHKPERGDVWHQEMFPDAEIAGVKKLLEPLKGKGLLGIDGTHEARIYNLTHISPAKEICAHLDMQYSPYWPVYYRLKVGRETYTFLIGHGSGYSQKSDYQIRKAMEVYRDAEIIMLGHNHRVYAESFTHLGIDEEGNEVEKEIYGVRTGAFLKYPEYGREKLYQPCKTGSPIVYLYSRRHIISVNTSRFPEYE